MSERTDLKLSNPRDPDAASREMITLLLRAAEDFDFSYNEEKTIESVLTDKIQNVSSEEKGNINATIGIRRGGKLIKCSLLSVVLNNLYPPHILSGKAAEWLLDNGASVKDTHPTALHKSIIKGDKPLLLKLYCSGMQPMDIHTTTFGRLSPLTTAIFTDRKNLAELFVNEKFLTLKDISDFHTKNSAMLNKFRRYSTIKDFDFLDKIQPTPFSLLDLSLQRISLLIGVQSRDRIVDTLEIPITLKEKLKFKPLEHYLQSFHFAEDQESTNEERLLVEIFRNVDFPIWRNPLK